MDIIDLASKSQGTIWELVIHAGAVVKFVLLLLFCFSIISWGIIFSKLKLVRRAKKESENFLDYFWKNKDLSSVNENILQYKNSPLAQVFHAGYQEIIKIKKAKAVRNPEGISFDIDTLGTEIDSIDNVHRALKNALLSQVTKLERALSFLATTGSTAPFIGLFGTVWGIMDSFRGIGLRGSASLDVVAPGISEALITTAAGLAAAIPAVVAYNYFVSRVKVLASEMDNFSSEFLNIVKRQYFHK